MGKLDFKKGAFITHRKAPMVFAIFGGETASVIAALIALLADLLGVVQMIVYIVFLSKAKKMLNKV